MADRDARYAVRGDLAIDGGWVRGAVVVEGGRIAEVLGEPRVGPLPETVIDAEVVAPGLIDLQVNGGFGVEVGEDAEAIRYLAERLPATGVTAFLPTVITASAAHYEQVFAAFAGSRDAAGARPLGLHLEGPFLSPLRAGAHRRELIEAADRGLFESLLMGGGLRLMTLAPEREGAHERIRRLRERGVLVSLGHTDAGYEEFVAGVDAGASMATHLFNAMSPFTHRAPGAIGAGLVDERVTVGLIADGVHSHPASVRLAVAAKGAERIALVTDMMPAAGMPPGRYELGGRPVIVDGISAKLEDGKLAGSVVTLDQAIRNVVRWTGATPAAAIRMASEVPARLLGLTEMGRIAAGGVADLVLFDGELNVEATIVGGRMVYQRVSGRTHRSAPTRWVTAMNGEIMAAEIREQPDILDRICRESWAEIGRAAAAVRRREPRFALFVARGTSDHAALYGKYLVETRLPLVAGLASPSTMTVYGARPDLRDVLVIAVSQSGASPDIVEPVVQARAAGAITVAVTNSAGSPLAEAAEFHLDVLAGPERAVAATKTYTAELLTLFLFVEALAGRDGAEAVSLPERARALLDREDETAGMAVRYRFAEQLVTTARGFNYPTAREAALKLMETSYLVAYAFSGADLLHGPVAMIDRGFPVIAIVPEGPGGSAMQPVLDGLRERGADTLIVGDPSAGPATRVLPIPDSGPEYLTPILTILPIQQFVWHLARERGTDPDQPRGLSKVTSTW